MRNEDLEKLDEAAATLREVASLDMSGIDLIRGLDEMSVSVEVLSLTGGELAALSPGVRAAFGEPGLYVVARNQDGDLAARPDHCDTIEQAYSVWYEVKSSYLRAALNARTGLQHLAARYAAPVPASHLK